MVSKGGVNRRTAQVQPASTLQMPLHGHELVTEQGVSNGAVTTYMSSSRSTFGSSFDSLSGYADGSHADADTSKQPYEVRSAWHGHAANTVGESCAITVTSRSSDMQIV